jgi:hypothetical protein
MRGALAMGDIPFDLLLDNPVALGVVGGLLLVLLVVVVVVVRRLVRRARQFAAAHAHRIDHARTAIAAATLHGPQREAVVLRQRLTASVTETDRLLAAAAGAPLVASTLGEQHRELGRLAAALDEHLRGLQREPDAARVQAALPDARRWTEQLCEVGATLREQVRASGTVTTEADVRALGASTSDGVAALRAGVDFLQAQVRGYRTGR